MTRPQQWDIGEDQIIIKPSSSLGCVSYLIIAIMGAVGLLVITFSTLYIYSAIKRGELEEGVFFVALILMLSQLIFIGIFNQFASRRGGEVHINRADESLSCVRDGVTQWRVSWRAIRELRVVRFVTIKHIEGSSRRQRINTSQLYLTLIDGSHFWLDSSLDHSQITRSAETLREFIRDHVDLEVMQVKLDRKQSPSKRSNKRSNKSSNKSFKSDPALFEQLEQLEIDSARDLLGHESPPSLSRYITGEIHEDGSESYQLLEDKTALDRYVYGVIFTFFATLIIGFGWLGLILLSTTGALAPIFMILFGIVLVFITAPAVLIFLGSRKRYTLRLSDDLIELKMDPKLGLLNQIFSGRFSRVAQIPKHAVRGVRINRLDQGHLWLSLAVNPEFNADPEGRDELDGSLIDSVKTFDTEQLARAGERELSVWYLCGLHREGRGAALDDLRYVQARVAERLIEPHSTQVT